MRGAAKGLAVLAVCLGVWAVGLGRPAAAAEPRNMFANPGFESGTQGWLASRDGQSEVSFAVTEGGAAEGNRSALLKLGTVTGWGCQFGQSLPGGQKGKTYTFAMKVKAEGGAVSLALQVERAGSPWDRAGRTAETPLMPDEWVELHTTFTPEADFPEGWFAYVSCTQSNVAFRVDAARFYEGEYAGERQGVPVEEAPPAPAPTGIELQPLPPAVQMFDTRHPIGGPLAADAPAHLDGWAAVSGGEAAHAFAGDAVLLNNHLAVAFRKGAADAEVYSVRPDGLKLRALLAPAGGSGVKVSAVELRANGPEAATALVTFRTADGKAKGVGVGLKAGQLFVKTDPGPGVAALRVEAPCRFGVLPNFFADDIVLDATTMPAERCELPSDNFFLHMLPDRDAMVMGVWTAREESLQADLAGAGPERVIRASEMPYGKDGSVYVAVLEGDRIWHARGVSSSDGGRIIRLNWRAPFIAHWRVDWTRDYDLTDTWDAAVATARGTGYRKPSFTGYEGSLPADRERWTTVLGTFQYPCWIEEDGQAFLQPLASVLEFAGPALVYPIGRVSETPLDVYTVTDVVRDTLGVGPCEYILDVEGQKATGQGRATCATRDLLDGIYGKGEQVARRAEVEQSLQAVIAFIKHIRGRIEHYSDASHQVAAYLTQQKQTHPELAGPIDKLISAAGAVDAHIAARRSEIKTPTDAEALADEFRAALLGYQGADALQRCQKFTAAWVQIGGNQDDLVGECRLAIKVLHQRAGLIMAQDPRMADIAREVRRQCEESLKNPTSYEAPRH